jgi:micrococcal nuclease
MAIETTTIVDIVTMLNKKPLLLISLILLLLIINYSFLDRKLINFFDDSERVLITRVIDGDTVVAGNISIRLLGINSPERGEAIYGEAKQFLEAIVLNKTIQLKSGKDKYDKYGRKLAYLFLGNKNINKELIDEGHANFYFPSGKDKYYKDFLKAWEHCLENNKNLCEKSSHECSSCIILEEFDIKNQEVVLENTCTFQCDLSGWVVKGQGRKKHVFNQTLLNPGRQMKVISQDLVFNSMQDSLFLRDEKQKLVLWKNY